MKMHARCLSVALALPCVLLLSFAVVSGAQASDLNWTPVAQLAVSSRQIAVQGNYAYCPSSVANQLLVLDVTDPASSFQVGQVALKGSSAWCIALDGSYAYIWDGSVLDIVDITNPARPGWLGSGTFAGDLSWWGGYLAVSNGNAYLLGGSGLTIVDVSNPLRPTYRGRWSVDVSAVGLGLCGNYAYVADGNDTLWVIDVSSPEHPTAVAHRVCRELSALAVSGGYAYVGQKYAGVVALDLGDPLSPTQVGLLSYAGYPPSAIAIADGFAYVAEPSNALVRLARVSLPRSPVALGCGSAYVGSHTRIAVSDSYVYVVGSGGVSPQVTVFRRAEAWLGEIDGQALDASSTPVASAAVKAVNADGLSWSAQTGANGVYQIASVPPGSYAITIAKADMDGQTKGGITVSAGSVKYVNFALHASGCLVGQVTSAAGAKLTNASVIASLAGTTRTTGATDSQAIYRLTTNLPEATTYIVTAVCPGYKPQTKATISVSPGQTTYVNFKLAPW